MDEILSTLGRPQPVHPCTLCHAEPPVLCWPVGQEGSKQPVPEPVQNTPFAKNISKLKSMRKNAYTNFDNKYLWPLKTKQEYICK